MKQFVTFTFPAIMTGLLIIVSGCKKKSEDSSTSGPVPVVQTVGSGNILLNTVNFDGNVTNDGGSFVTKRGFCWSSTEANPTILNFSVESGAGAGPFTALLEGLAGQTTFHVRAFATNSNGTGYGSSFVVTTIDTTVTDIDNNHYRVVQIGSQVWMAENLKTRDYNDYLYIPWYADNTTWSNLDTPGLTWYNNDEATYGAKYGILYNWYTVNTGKLAPAGWHVPTEAEWNTMINTCGGTEYAGGKLKSTGTIQSGTGIWNTPNQGASNSTGFSAFPGGDRFGNGGFYDLGNYCIFWTSTEKSTSDASCLSLSYTNTGAIMTQSSKTLGYSVRCMRD
jgi:uncharacterized protein (TIGR02145 family)